MEDQNLNLTLPLNETILINETNEILEENLSSSAEIVSITSETIPADFTSDYNDNYDSNLIGYRIEQDGDKAYLYPDMLIDEISFISLSNSLNNTFSSGGDN